MSDNTAEIFESLAERCATLRAHALMGEDVRADAQRLRIDWLKNRVALRHLGGAMALADSILNVCASVEETK